MARNKIQLFIDAFKDINKENYSLYCHILKQLKELGECEENYNSILDALKLTQDVFYGLDTEYLRFQILEKIGVLLSPIAHEINNIYMNRIVHKMDKSLKNTSKFMQNISQ